jgi:hypothetical protein
MQFNCHQTDQLHQTTISALNIDKMLHLRPRLQVNLISYKIKSPYLANPRARLIEGESVETGKVKWSVYMAYIRAIGYGVSLFFLIIYFLSSGLGVKSNMWLADWSDEALQQQRKLKGGLVIQTEQF